MNGLRISADRVPSAMLQQAEIRFPAHGRTLRISACPIFLTNPLSNPHRNKEIENV